MSAAQLTVVNAQGPVEIGLLSVQVNGLVQAARNEALFDAQQVPEITDELYADLGRQALKKVKGFLSALERSREETKAPVLDVGRKIDALAKDLAKDLEAHKVRLERALGNWDAEQKRIADEAERKRLADLKRQQDEAAAEARRKTEAEAEAEKQRIAAEAEKLKETAGILESAQVDDAARQATAQVEASVQQRAHVAAEVARQDVAAAAVPARRLITPPAPRWDVEFEVQDLDKLYRYAPALVKLEAKRAEIKAMLKDQPENFALPGITWKRIPLAR